MIYLRKKFITTEKFISQKRELLASLLRVGIPLMRNDAYKSIRTNWIPVYVNGDNFAYFHSFGVEL